MELLGNAVMIILAVAVLLVAYNYFTNQSVENSTQPTTTPYTTTQQTTIWRTTTQQIITTPVSIAAINMNATDYLGRRVAITGQLQGDVGGAFALGTYNQVTGPFVNAKMTDSQGNTVYLIMHTNTSTYYYYYSNYTVMGIFHKAFVCTCGEINIHNYEYPNLTKSLVNAQDICIDRSRDLYQQSYNGVVLSGRYNCTVSPQIYYVNVSSAVRTS